MYVNIVDIIRVGLAHNDPRFKSVQLPTRGLAFIAGQQEL